MAQRISIEVTDALVSEAKTKLADFRGVLSSLLVALPPEDAKKLFSST